MVILDPKKWPAWSCSASKQHCCSSPKYFKRPRAKAPRAAPRGPIVFRWTKLVLKKNSSWTWVYRKYVDTSYIISDWYIIYMNHIYWIRGSKTNEHHWGAPPCRNSLGALRSGDIPLFCPGGNFQATTAFWDRETMWCDRLTNISVYSFNVYINILLF